MQLADCEPNFFSGWHHTAMILLVDLLRIALGRGGGKDDGKIHHPSVNCSYRLPIFDLEVGGRAAAVIAL